MNPHSPSRLIGCVCLLSLALFLMPAFTSCSTSKTSSVTENASIKTDSLLVDTADTSTSSSAVWRKMLLAMLGFTNRIAFDTVTVMMSAPKINDATPRPSIPQRKPNEETIILEHTMVTDMSWDSAAAEMPTPEMNSTASRSSVPQRRPNRQTINNHAPILKGEMVFDWPSRMKLDETHLIHLVIACNVPLRYLQEQVDSLAVVDADTAGQHRRRRSKTQVRLGRRMKATLMGASPGDSGVTIVRPPDDDGSRIIDLQTDTSVVWSWNVTPHKAGPMKLTMYLTRLDDGDSRPVDVQTILVEGIPPSLFDQVIAVLTKLNGLWVLLSTGAGGALIALIKYLRDRRSLNEPVPTTAPGQN